MYVSIEITVNGDNRVKLIVSTHPAQRVDMFVLRLLTVWQLFAVRPQKTASVFDVLDVVCVVSNAVDSGTHATPTTGYVYSGIDRIWCEGHERN